MSEPTMFVLSNRGGRPARMGDPSTKRVSMWLTPEEDEEIDRTAKANGMSRSALIREAVNSFVGDYGEGPVFTSKPSRYTKTR